jgi:hypothetical protein
MLGKSGILCPIGIFVSAFPALAVSPEPVLCDSVVLRLVNQLVTQVPIGETPRVEVRRCEQEGTESLQIAAWESKTARPALLISTTEFTIVQTVARQNLFLIETTGGTRDRIYVIVYQNDKPTLKLQRTTKGTAQITMDRNNLDLVIPDIYAGDLPPRTEKYHYPLQ